ncbi:MAG: hypothetical protein WC806_01205 [Candidatus Gracilibacteria bacterium]
MANEDLTPLNLDEFEQEMAKVTPDLQGCQDNLYQRLYLGLPKGLRTLLRELADKAQEQGCGSESGIEEAIVALRLLGPQEYQSLLEESAIQEAISTALDSAHHQVSIEVENALDCTHDNAIGAIVEDPKNA